MAISKSTALKLTGFKSWEELQLYVELETAAAHMAMDLRSNDAILRIRTELDAGDVQCVVGLAPSLLRQVDQAAARMGRDRSDLINLALHLVMREDRVLYV